MKIKKLLAFSAVFSLIICSAFWTAIPAGAEGAMINWIEVYDRWDARSGLSFAPAALLEGVEETRDSEFVFTFVVESSLNPDERPEDFEGVDFKVVTQGGVIQPGGAFRYQRFTGPALSDDIEFFLGETVMVAHVKYGGTDVQDFTTPRFYLSDMAEFGHEIAICSQRRTDVAFRSFYVKNIIVEHIVNGESTIIYEMANDPLVQGLEDGAEFTDGSKGLSRADIESEQRFEASYRIVRGPAPAGANVGGSSPEVTEPPVTTTSAPAETTAEPAVTTTPAPAQDSSDGSNSFLFVLIGVIAASLLGATGGAFVLMKK